jgi:ADP-ribosylglycohydrolase
LGLAICDALGASTEFQPFIKSGYEYIHNGFHDIEVAIKNDLLDTRAGKVGIWTDDCSMALCIADSLIYYKYHFNPKHMRYLFLLWFFNGLDNGGRKHSIGLGGNIKISM